MAFSFPKRLLKPAISEYFVICLVIKFKINFSVKKKNIEFKEPDSVARADVRTT